MPGAELNSNNEHTAPRFLPLPWNSGKKPEYVLVKDLRRIP
jgi:hypothetical protein